MGNIGDMAKLNCTRKSVQIHTRKLDRSVAHKNMERAGLRKVNKKEVDNLFEDYGSYFSNHWREYVNVPTVDLRRGNR